MIAEVSRGFLTCSASLIDFKKLDNLSFSVKAEQTKFSTLDTNMFRISSR